MLALHRFPPSVVLQSGSTAEAPALGPPLAAWVVPCLVGLVLGLVGAAIVRRLSNPVGKFRLLYLGVVAPFGLFAYGVLSLLDFGAALRAPLVGPGSGPLRVVLADFLTMLAAGIVGLAVYAPTVRAVSDARDIDLGTRGSLATMARYLLGLSLLFALAFAPFRLGGADSPLAVAAGLLVLVGVLVAASPWLVAVLRSTSRPTGADADRLAALRDRAGLDVRDVRVLDTDDKETASALVRGPPGYRRLFVTSTFLDAFDDDAATALLAVQAGRVRSRVLVRRFCALVGAVFPLVAALSGWGPRWPLLIAAALALVGGLWLARRASSRPTTTPSIGSARTPWPTRSSDTPRSTTSNRRAAVCRIRSR
ncbi:peptidase [Halorarum halophilum]|uniref:Peptidase n=1 Tax=Halorarum halophilum TaxID=2743090 RepID=A0A7D5GCL4_9EURY|nr:peptidase [Halobaculum halophilum]QLG28305.1 peptidase [Halobaculum halophilum]